MRDVLLYFIKKYEGDGDSIYMALANKEQISMKDLAAVKSKYHFISFVDEGRYIPTTFGDLKPIPFGIFVLGNKDLLYVKTGVMIIDHANTSQALLKDILEDGVKHLIVTTPCSLDQFKRTTFGKLVMESKTDYAVVSANESEGGTNDYQLALGLKNNLLTQ